MNTSEAIARYLTLTRETLPEVAGDRGWPIRNDHCFQRVVLDTVSGGVWYDHIARPAYRHMTADQLGRAIALSEDILSGDADLDALNARSIALRRARNSSRPCPAEPLQKTLDV